MRIQVSIYDTLPYNGTIAVPYTYTRISRSRQKKTFTLAAPSDTTWIFNWDVIPYTLLFLHMCPPWLSINNNNNNSKGGVWCKVLHFQDMYSINHIQIFWNVMDEQGYFSTYCDLLKKHSICLPIKANLMFTCASNATELSEFN